MADPEALERAEGAAEGAAGTTEMAWGLKKKDPKARRLRGARGSHGANGGSLML